MFVISTLKAVQKRSVAKRRRALWQRLKMAMRGPGVLSHSLSLIGLGFRLGGEADSKPAGDQAVDNLITAGGVQSQAATNLSFDLDLVDVARGLQEIDPLRVSLPPRDVLDANGIVATISPKLSPAPIATWR